MRIRLSSQEKKGSGVRANGYEFGRADLVQKQLGKVFGSVGWRQVDMAGSHCKCEAEVLWGSCKAAEDEECSASRLEEDGLQCLCVATCRLYCSVMWQECTKELKQQIEWIQKFGMRLILSQPPHTPSDGMRHGLKWISPEKWRSISHLALLHRCLNRQAPQYLTELVRRNG